MPRKMSAENESHFEELSIFIEYYATNVLGIDRKDKIHPSNCLEEIVEKFGKSKALQGLKQAVNDTIEDTQDLDAESVRKLDSALAKNNIVTLSMLRRRYWSKYKKVLERGSIKNETEYYLTNSLLCDMGSEITEEERELLSIMVDKFEQNA